MGKAKAKQETSGVVTAADFFMQSEVHQTSRRYVEHPIRKWGGRKLRFRSLSELERSRDIENWQADDPDVRCHLIKARLIQLCAVNPDDSLMFPDDLATCQRIVNMDTAITAPLYGLILEHLSFDQADVDTLEKNSEGTTADNSRSV